MSPIDSVVTTASGNRTDAFVDKSAIVTAQLSTALLLTLAFVLDVATMAIVVGVVNLTAVAAPRLSPYRWLYERVLEPAGVGPRIVHEDAAPHRFAARFSGVVTVTGGTLATIADLGFGIGTATAATYVGWALVLLVVALAVVNATVDWCAGCATHRVIQRAR